MTGGRECYALIKEFTPRRVEKRKRHIAKKKRGRMKAKTGKNFDKGRVGRKNSSEIKRRRE